MAKKDESRESKAKKSLDEFVSHYDGFQNAAKFSKQVTGSRPKISNSAKEEIKKLVYDPFVKQGVITAPVPVSKASDLPFDFARSHLQKVQRYYGEKSSLAIGEDGSKINDIVQSAIGDKGIELLVGIAQEDEELRAKVSSGIGDKEKELLNHYLAYRSMEGLQKRVYDGVSGKDAKKNHEQIMKNIQKLPEEQRKLVLGVASEGAAQKVRDRMKADGLSEDLQEDFAEATRDAVLRGLYNAEDIAAGFKKEAEKTKDAYMKYQSDKGVTLRDYASKVLQTLAKGSDEDYEQSKRLLYTAAKAK